MRQDRNSAPLVAALRQKAEEGPDLFCIPAHRQGRGADPELRALLGERVFTADLTEMEGLDDLHAPSGVIAEAEAKAAALWGSDACRFLVNGSTSGVEAMILAAAEPGSRILLSRHVHKSVLLGLILSGAQPVWLEPEELPDWQLDGGISPDEVHRKLEEVPDCRAFLLVSPTYYGICSPLREIAAVCHEHGIPLLVDEAHGSHLYFDERAPEGAVTAGADLTVQSLHKTGGSMTQSSLLHIRGGRADVRRVDQSIRLVTSTSPSYVLMASLDGARRQLAGSGPALTAKARALAELCRERLRGTEGVDVLSAPLSDPLRVVFTAARKGLSGLEIQRELYARSRISVELADRLHVVLVVTWGNTEEEILRLTEAVAAVVSDRTGEGCLSVPARERNCPEVFCTPREAWYGDSESVPLEEAAGRVAAESVIPYPPGVPVLYPGEVVTEGLCRYIRQLAEAGVPVHGPEEPRCRRLRVLSKSVSKV